MPSTRGLSLGILLLAHVTLPPLARAAEHAVRGTHLLVSADRSRLVVAARDPSIMVQATEDDDPTRVGGELLVTIQTAMGVSTQTLTLPAAGWSRRDKPFGTSLRFASADAPGATTAVRGALLREGRWKAKAHVSALPAGSDVVSIAARLRTGTSTWCALFAERIHIGPRGTVTARRQPVPARICPALGSTSTTTTTTTIPGCGCGDAICQADESQETCFADCRVERAPILPIIVGSCALSAFQQSGSCKDLPAQISITDLGPRPDGSCIWNWGQPSSPDPKSVLPSQCCIGGTCGGGGAAIPRHIGDVVYGPEGSLNATLGVMRGCLDTGIDEFVVALADCADLAPSCTGPATIRGFATVRLLSAEISGNPLVQTFEVLCTSDGPCGLGVCPADCDTCPADCGGCAPPCS